VLHLSAALTGLLPIAGNSVDLLTENDYAFDQIEQAIEEAQESIWAEYYIISNDETGHHFLELLAAKARKGIEVLLLYDAIGSLRIDAKRLSEIKAAGGKTETFLPVNPLKKRWSVHLRNHRKIIIIDGKIGFTGGMNMGNEYSGRKWRKKPVDHFRDTHLSLRGPAASDLAQIFTEDWTFATGETLAFPEPMVLNEKGTSVVTVVPSGPDQKYNASSLVYFTGITSAQKRCYLSTPYFIPDEPTIQALISAAARGVDVRVLVPEKSDIAIAGQAARSYYPKLVHAGVRIFEYRASMLHSKSLAVDGAWGIVGSANADIRSFRLNFELGVIVTDDIFTQHLENRFFQDFSQSREVRVEDLYQRGFMERLWQGTCRLLSPLL
jgi:cardiolipin synthase